MPNIQGAKLYLASFALMVWMAYFRLDTAPIHGDALAALQWGLPIVGAAPIPFLGIEITSVLQDLARKLAGKGNETGNTL